MGPSHVQRCHFNRFVDKAIVFDSNYDGYQSTDLRFSYSLTIENTWFDSVTSSSYGSAIETTKSCVVTIKSCVFSNMYSPKEGGAIYIGGPITNISKCCFSCCFCGELGNAEKGGNAFEVIGNCSIEFCHATQCSPNITRGGDSLFHLFNGMNIVKEFNGTHNYAPHHGGLGGAFHYQDPNSSISFSIFSESRDHNLMESWYSTLTIFKCNFVNNYNKDTLFLSVTSTVNIQSCTLYGNLVKPSGSNVFYSDCYTDYSITGATMVPNIFQNATGFSICKADTPEATPSQTIPPLTTPPPSTPPQTTPPPTPESTLECICNDSIFQSVSTRTVTNVLLIVFILIGALFCLLFIACRKTEKSDSEEEKNHEKMNL